MNSAALSVSVIIPTYNGRKLLATHLPHVIAAVGSAQIIVVDDASTDGSVAFVQTHFPQVTLITQPRNQRFAAACNRGVAAATGEIVILLNNDVSPSPGFLAPLLAPFTDSQVFAVGCAEVKHPTVSGPVSGRACARFAQGLVLHYRCPDQTGPTSLWASGGSGAFRRSMWERLGGMDLLFKPAYEEDRDLCYRALKRGWRVLFAADSLVYHDHESTNKEALGMDLIRLASFKNQLLFVWKNITQPALFRQHLFWLLYHLTITTLRTRGLFLRSFVWALRSLPQIRQRRRQEIRESVVDDETIFNRCQA